MPTVPVPAAGRPRPGRSRGRPVARAASGPPRPAMPGVVRPGTFAGHAPAVRGGRRHPDGADGARPGVPFADRGSLDPTVAGRGAGSGFGGGSRLEYARPEDAPAEQAEQAADQLVDRARAGDVEAFGRLYDRYQPVVHRYVSYRVGTPALAEDIVSETFLRALRGIGGFTWQGRDVGAWLVTIARHLIVDHLKSSRFRLERPTADVLAVAPAVLVAGPEDEVIELMTNTALLDAIRGLGPEQQECVVLRFLEGMSVRETALSMGKNEGAVKALQYRAVRALARTLPAGAVGRG